MAVTDQDGKVKYSYHYTPYGELLEGEYSDTVPFLYNGKVGVTVLFRIVFQYLLLICDAVAFPDTVPFLYNGQFGVATDGNGLYYMRARYYNVDIKRFINQDVLTGTLNIPRHSPCP